MKDLEPQEGSCSAPGAEQECPEECSVPPSTAASVELSTRSHARSGLLVSGHERETADSVERGCSGSKLTSFNPGSPGVQDGLRSKTDGKKVTSSEPAGDEDEGGSSRSCEAGEAGPPAAADSADDTPKW